MTNRNVTTRAALLASSMITGVALVAASTSAYAQAAGINQPTGATPIAQPDQSGGSTGSTVQELVVTGSRIPQPNLTSISPLTTVTAAEVRLSGTTNVEQLLNDLPSATAAQVSQISNGTTGTATINLRDLGQSRTLVLVDGKRLMPGDPIGPFPDVNNIPAALVDRVDVVTGGASAVYGSDAVAGVVNFIMKKNFEGVQVDYQYGFDNHQNRNAQAAQFLPPFGLSVPKDTNDGGIHEFSIILGANSPDEKGNITAYATYQHTDAILQGTRDFSDCGVATVTGAHGVANNQHVCVGSSNTAYGRFDHVLNPATGGFINVANSPNGTNTFVPYTTALGYNFNPLNYLQRVDDRYTAGFFAHYDINKALEVYSDFMFMDDFTTGQVAPSGLFRNQGPNLSSGYSINCNNPLMSASQAAALCPGAVITPGAPDGAVDALQSIGYRFASVPRDRVVTHTDYKVDLGLRGDLGSGWTYDVYAQLGVARLERDETGFASEQKVQNALDVVYAPGTTTPVCVTGGACVPLNIFKALGTGITPQALGYVLVDGLTTGETREQVVSGSVTGDLGRYGLKSPWAADGVGLSFGAEYRRDSLELNFDQEYQSGDLSGAGGQLLPQNGATDVKELFGEIRVPIAHGLPFLNDLSLDAGYRFSHYNLAGDTNTYKFGAEWKPIESLLIRGGYNRAVRAPNVSELFLPQTAGLATYTDPCASDTGTPVASLAQCLNTGLKPNQYGNLAQCPSSQCEVLNGGNPTGLKPEVADTYSIGGVFTPQFLPGFNASIDYFYIKVSGVISAGVAPAPAVLQGCLADAASPYCALIHRDPVTGGLDTAQGYVLQLSSNAGYLQTDGVDATVNYHYHLPDWWRGSSAGSLDLSFVGTWVNHFINQPVAGGGTYDCAGLYGATCGVPLPHLRTVTRVTWNTPIKLTLSLRWRYNGPVDLDYLSSNPLLGQPGLVDNVGNEAHVKSYSYFDLAVTYKVRDGLVLRGGVNNLLDTDPPVMDSSGIGISGPAAGNGNTFPGFYDSLGRNVFVGLTANF